MLRDVCLCSVTWTVSSRSMSVLDRVYLGVSVSAAEADGGPGGDPSHAALRCLVWRLHAGVHGEDGRTTIGLKR